MGTTSTTDPMHNMQEGVGRPRVGQGARQRVQRAQPAWHNTIDASSTPWQHSMRADPAALPGEFACISSGMNAGSTDIMSAASC